MNLNNTRIVLTGGAGGLGLATATVLGGYGAAVRINWILMNDWGNTKMNKIARGMLWLWVGVFFAYGATGLFAPQLISQLVDLSQVTVIGTSEIRGLFGGGFAAFGLVLLIGLRKPALAPGLFLSIAVIMGGLVVGRLFSMTIDQEFSFTIPATVAEAIVAWAAWIGSREAQQAMETR